MASSAPDPLNSSGSFSKTLRRRLFGAPRDVTDVHVMDKMSLIAFLAWVGLGADGLSSSAYGPEEAFRALGTHTYLLVALAVATALTVLIISASYRSIIDEFPTGGGGYVVASRLLGPKTGVISGCALIVDYVLTITVSIAGAGNAIFSFLPPAWHGWKLAAEAVAIVILIGLNLRGVKESVQLLTPIFLAFLATHALLIVWAIGRHFGEIPEVARGIGHDFDQGFGVLGGWAMLLLFLRAYCLGGGTYTGIEAVSNGLQIMREPRAETGKRTMTYMAISLAATAAGILIGYLLLHTRPVEGKTMNAVLSEQVFAGWPGSEGLVWLTMISEGLLLVVAAQAGFIDGPRVMSNMAIDSYLPHRFSSLSERLTMQNGVVLMGFAALALLLQTAGNIHVLIVMYSINVFVTFSLSQLGMGRLWLGRRNDPRRGRHLFIHGLALVLCVSILLVMAVEKFGQGGWVTLIITTALVLLCYGIHRHYESVKRGLRQLDDILGAIHKTGEPNRDPLDPNRATAVVLVNGFNGLGVHTILSIARFFPGLYKQFVFVSIAVVDSGHFKGREEIEHLVRQTRSDLDHYVEVARQLGFAAERAMEVGTEVVEPAVELCGEIAKKYPKSTIFTGKLVFRRERWFQKLLHNETPNIIQQRLQWMGVPMVTLPIRAQV